MYVVYRIKDGVKKRLGTSEDHSYIKGYKTRMSKKGINISYEAL